MKYFNENSSATDKAKKKKKKKKKNWVNGNRKNYEDAEKKVLLHPNDKQCIYFQQEIHFFFYT